MLPVEFSFSPESPRVRYSPFLQKHHEVMVKLRGQAPSSFERATGDALWQAYVRLSESSTDPLGSIGLGEHSGPQAFLAVSAATGSGKSLGACALIAHLSPAPCAFVIKTVEEAEKVYRHLSKLLPGRVAVYSSLHKNNASPTLTEEKFRELGLRVARRFTETEFKEAQVVVTTHERWKQEIEKGTDLGVRLYKGRLRELVIVDEDPSLERVYVCQPEHVSKLASVFADTVLSSESRSYGFTTSHHAAAPLLTIHDRMRSIKDNASGKTLYPADLVTSEDAAVILGLQYVDVAARMSHVSQDKRTFVADELWSTVEFLKAASQGRVFYSRSATDAAFYAYELMLPPQPRTLVLDGTADLNGMYAVGSHVIVTQSERPKYKDVELALVNPPAEFVGKMNKDKLLKSRRNLVPYMKWFLSFLLENTSEGESVLVYAKQVLLSYDIHKDAEFDESQSDNPNYSELKGRKIHWCHFGRGRGSNQWEHCTAYFRLGEWHMRKSALLASIGSTTGKTFTDSELSALSSGRTQDAMLRLAQETHLVTSSKQDAARICIRHLADDGTAQAAHVYLVDCDKSLMLEYRDRMFPGSKPYRLMECDHEKLKQSSRVAGEQGKRDGVKRLADLLLTDNALLTSAVIAECTGIASNNIDKALASSSIAPIAKAQGWTKTTRKAVGLTGKGYVLTRAA